MRGKIITIEGLDGSGKSTQTELLQQHLSLRGIENHFIHFPRLMSGEYGHLIAEYLRGEFGTLDEVHPKLVALLFAEDRKEHIPQVKRWLEEDSIVLMDRYVHSNIAFQCAKLADLESKKQLKEWILDFEFGHNALPRPDISIYLDLPLQSVATTLSTQRKGEDRAYLKGGEDIHEASVNLQGRVLEEYMKIIDEDPGFYKINCLDSDGNRHDKQQVHQQIVSLLESKSILS